jgi:hypothetical protein
MKKQLFAAFIVIAGLAISTSAHAQLQGLVDKAKGAGGFDVSKLTSSIMGKLNPTLNLTAAQKPKVTDAVATYLTGKSKIVNLQATDPSAYTQKQGSLFSTLKSKLSGILLKNQLQKFMGMKPKTNNPLNSLSQLFY